MLEEDFEKLKNEMCNIMGVDEYNFLYSRKYPLSYARAIVANAMYNLNYTYVDIGKVMKKSHSSLVYICHKLQEIKDCKQFSIVNRIYKQFYERIENVRD